jgi:PAS domain S-box-containing protein
MSTDLQSLSRNTVGLSQELLFEAGLDGAMRIVNPAWTLVLGWSEAELQSKKLVDLVHPDDVEPTRDAISRAIDSRALLAIDARCRARDGMYRWLAWKMLVEDDVLRGAGHDVTAVMSRDGKVVHDINNLMQNIVGALELVRKLLETGRQAETERFITSAIACAHKAAELNQRHAAPRSAPAEESVQRSVEK